MKLNEIQWKNFGVLFFNKIIDKITLVVEALVIFFCSNFMVSGPAGRQDMFEMPIVGLMLRRLLREFNEVN